MKQTIKKYHKSSLTLISIALLSVATFSQAQAAEEWNGSTIKLCGKFQGWGAGAPRLNTGYSLSMVEGMDAHEETSLREDLRRQASVSIRSHTMGFNLEPRFLINEVSIINTNSNNPINISDSSAKIRHSGQFYVLSNLLIRSFDLDPDQILTGKTTISGPGVHYVNEETVRLGDLPANQIHYNPSCKISHVES